MFNTLQMICFKFQTENASSAIHNTLRLTTTVDDVRVH